MAILKTLLARNQMYIRRCYATGTKFVEVTQDKDTDISIISMARTPVNSLNTELSKELKTSLLEVQNNRSKGIILTSSLPTIFSAGLDIMEMYNTSKQQKIDFWHALQDAWLTLYSMNIPTTAAINGSSPAGGCLLAISTEYRVFVNGKHTMGLNETQLGLTAPNWFRDPYISLLGYRQAELALLRGKLFKPEQALELGLVDELAIDKADAIEKCKNYILSYKNISSIGRATTKLQMRDKLIQWMKENKEADTDVFIKFLETPQVQASLKLYIEFLKKQQ